MQGIKEVALHYLETNPEAAALALEKCTLDERVTFLEGLEPDLVSRFIPHAPAYLALAFLTTLSMEKCLSVLDMLDPKLSSAYLRRFELGMRTKILDGLSESKRKVVESSLNFLPGTAGYLMDSSSNPLKIGGTVEEALEILKRDSCANHYSYVVDESDKLVGVVTIKELLQEQNSGSMIDDLMTKSVGSINVDNEKHEILDNRWWREFASLPVVDFSDRYLGVLEYKTYCSLRDESSSDERSKDLDSISNALSELYGIGFSALVGSTSTLIPEESK